MSERDYIALAAEYQAGVLDGTIAVCKWVRLACERNRKDLDRQDTPEFPYHFDPEAGRRICRMAEMLPHIKGPKAKIIGRDEHNRAIWNPLVLEPWQCWYLTTMFGWVHQTTGLRRFRVSMLLVPRKNGKALALDTEIPTPDGFRPMRDIYPGDYVFGSDGKPTLVIAESPVMVGQTCYEVEFSTGEKIVADAGHQWLTRARVDSPGKGHHRYGKAKGPGCVRVRTTEELAQTVTFGARGDVNHSVAVARALDLPDADLAIDPYVLGVWLGDGTSAAGQFTNADREVVEAVAAIEGEVRAGAQKGAAITYAIGRSYRDGQPAAATFQGRLRSLGLLNNKHIPVEYLRGSQEQRLALLQGLMDTDGTVSKAGQLTFVSTSKVLAAGAKELIASLGFKPSMRSRDAKLYGRVVGTAHSIQFWAGDTPVFRIARKLERQRPSGKTARSTTRQIVAVRQVPSVPVKCIAVDSPDHLFLVGRSFVPTHNSVIAAVIVLYMLTSDGESGAECYSVATTRDQAKVVAEIAWEMAKRSPLFCEYFGVRVGAKTTYTLTIPATASKFQPLSADAHTLDGLNISLAVVDELHAHKTREVYGVVDTATGARPQPYIVITTTAGVEIGGICHEKMSYLHKVLEGLAVDETFFGMNYTIDEADDYRLPAIHKKCNPNWGVSVDPSDLQRKVNEAQHSQAAINNVLTKHCNVWVRSESGWMGADLWQTCTREIRLEDFVGVPCWIGVDLAEVRDFAALVILFRSGERYSVFARLYMPEATIQKSPIAQLSGWVRGEHVISTGGDQADFQRIEDDIVTWCQRFKVQEIDFDRALASQMQQSLKRRFEATMGRDAADLFVVTVPQNIETMDGAMKKTERLVLSKQIEHDGNPAFATMISNIVVERNQKDEIYPRKAGGKDSPHKIDGPMALFTCLSRAMLGAAEPVGVLMEYI